VTDPVGRTDSPPPRRTVVVPIVLGVALLVLAAIAVQRRCTAPGHAGDAGGDAAANGGVGDERNADGELMGRKLADFGELGEFTLVDQFGKPFDKKSLDRKIWVFDFVYTTCPGPCVELTAKMKKLAAAFSADADVQFASVSVDPENDSPPVMARFAATNGADSPRWRFLTGTKQQADHVRAEVFKDSKGEKGLHSTRIYVVDRDAHLRAMHDTQDGVEWEAPARHSVRLLLEQQPR
jgi:protein SCO1/2